jgi:hypothetical protein
MILLQLTIENNQISYSICIAFGCTSPMYVEECLKFSLILVLGDLGGVVDTRWEDLR